MECAVRIKQARHDGHPKHALRELAVAFSG
jgi:hypothetical protein